MIRLKDNIVASGLRALLSQFAESERFRAFVAVFLEELREAESTIYDLYWNRTLDGASGAQLDQYGKIVRVERDGLNDSDYLRFIRVGLLVLYARGDAERIRRIVELASGSSDVHYINNGFASYSVTYALLEPLPSAIKSRILRAVEAATPSGVSFAVVESSTVYFGFDEDDDALGLDEGELAEDLN